MLVRTLLTPNRLHNSCTTSLVKARLLCHKTQRSAKDVKVVVVQDTGHSMSSRILCHEGHSVSGKVVSDHEDIYHSGFFFNSFSQSPLTSILVKSRWSRSMGPVASIGTSRALTLSPS